MGQQQLLLLILGVIIVGLAIAVGISLFGAGSTEANKDGVTSSLVNIAADAHQFKLRPKVLGGGRPSYANYALPVKLQSDDNGTYEIVGTPSDNQLTVRGTSSLNSSWNALCVIDSNGFTLVSYNGW
ncbi:MAG: hypothetical protein HY800_08025 [Ignavibacteriales bacterium]|nr:hypothetical protein [Ignavibacteriales bacterium]